LSEPLLSVSCAVLPENGEDSFALGQDEHSAYLCAADGCGGLGSRRYASLEGKTGAYIASRLVTGAFEKWVQEKSPMPSEPDEGRRLCQELAEDLHGVLESFAAKHCCEEKSRIVGSMQRTLPTTLCAAVTRLGAAGWREVSFLWSGDSRGYVLDENGLHQCTQDHLRGECDAFENLYRDQPLASLLSAERPAQISLRRMRAPLPGVVLVATDGAYASLPTPMEFEMLLLNTLISARSWESWRKKLCNQLKKLAQDDATILLQPCGMADLESLQKMLAPRRAFLQKQFITPVRRHRRDVGYAREKWRLYRETYDWTEGGRHERMDWRV